GILPRNLAGRPDGGNAVFPGGARLRADLQGVRRLQLRARRHGAVRGTGDGSLLGVDPAVDRHRKPPLRQPGRVPHRRPDHGGAGMAGRTAGAAPPGQPGRRHPADGHAGHHLLRRRCRPDLVRQQRLQDRHRDAQGSGDRVRVGAAGRHPDQHRRPVRGRHRNRPSGGAEPVLPEDLDRPRLARGGRRPPGGPVHRHSARPHLGHRVVRRGCRGPGGGNDLGQQAGCAVLAGDRGLARTAGGDPRRLDLRPRRHHRRPDHRRGREALGGLHRPDGRRRHRDLVRVRARARVPAVPAAGPVRREDHRPGL
ncbi:MAG: High-affinity branched-chain amino acid transport system permease protein LivH, partial [uncultured Ramlibacter sp.]